MAEIVDMALKRIALREKYRIAAPAHGVDSNDIRKTFEVLHDLLFVRHIELNIPAVRGNCNEPILAVVLQSVHLRQHRRRVLGTECDQIHHVRRKAVTCHRLKIIRISHQHISLFNPI